jgi:hypothetical protein
MLEFIKAAEDIFIARNNGDCKAIFWFLDGNWTFYTNGYISCEFIQEIADYYDNLKDEKPKEERG